MSSNVLKDMLQENCTQLLNILILDTNIKDKTRLYNELSSILDEIESSLYNNDKFKDLRERQFELHRKIMVSQESTIIEE
jgi:hypothetical protein